MPVWILLLWLAGCAQPVPIVPTQLPLAVVPTVVTVTPAATVTPLPTSTATPTLTPTATSTPTSTPTPTPNEIPPYTVQDQIVTPFLETPPGSVACDGTGVIFRSKFPSEYGGDRYYTAYLPPCYGQQGRVYPVLYLFHGSIQTDSHWVELGLPDILDAGIASGQYPPFIVIMPYNTTVGNNTSGGDHSIEGITVNAMLPYIDAHYCTWAAAEGRSIGGISRGGYWALMIAFRHPDLFTSVSGHSSHLRYETDKAEYNPLSTYAEADLSQMRIWLDWGEKDFLYYGQKTLHESLETAGIVHEAHVNEGGHNTTYWLAHIQAYLDWHAAAWSLEPLTSVDCMN
ncbi:MAG: alpha/beta hydrolase-fold protein [Chloroflexota bacterium]